MKKIKSTKIKLNIETTEDVKSIKLDLVKDYLIGFGKKGKNAN